MGWNKEDDARLASLFRKGKKNGVASTLDLSKKHILEIARKHWPERATDKKIDAFCTLFRKKARAFNLNKAISGGRKKDTAAKKNSRKTSEESEEEEDDDHQDVAALDEQESNPQEDTTVDNVTEDIGTMTFNDKKPEATSLFSFDVWFPYFMYKWIHGNFWRVTLDFLVIGMHRSMYQPTLTDGTTLQLGMIIPDVVRLANQSRVTNRTSNKITSYKQVLGQATADRKSATDPMMGNPMCVKLPIECETQIHDWNVYALNNLDANFTRDCGGLQQFFFILTVELVGVKRVKKEFLEGAMCLLGSPAQPIPEPDDEDDEDDAEENNAMQQD